VTASAAREDDRSLEGWAPEPGPDLTLPQIIERAFDYRGNVTVVGCDGTVLEGYLFNRDAEAAEPFVQVYDRDGGGPTTIPYGRIRTIRFSGRDMAAGQSYAAWVRRREAEKVARLAPPPASP
jgi:hypothetical protein